MRTMYDAINPELIPLSANPQMVAGYVNGKWPSYNGYTDSNGHYVPSIRQRFPNAVHVSIAVNAYADAQVLDCEQFDATPAECPPWATRQRARGQIPTVYMNSSTWPYVINEFHKQGVAEPNYWVADYDNIPVIIPGSIAKQYGGPTGLYDLSAVADYWPGIDGNDIVTLQEMTALITQLLATPIQRVDANGKPTSDFHPIRVWLTTNTVVDYDAVAKAVVANLPPANGSAPASYTGTIELTPKV